MMQEISKSKHSQPPSNDNYSQKFNRPTTATNTASPAKLYCLQLINDTILQTNINTYSPMTQVPTRESLPSHQLQSLKTNQLNLFKVALEFNQQTHKTMNYLITKLAMTADDFKPIVQSGLNKPAFIAQPFSEHYTIAQSQVFKIARVVTQKQGKTAFESLMVMNELTRLTESYRNLTIALEQYIQVNGVTKPTSKISPRSSTPKHIIRKINSTLSLLKVEPRLCQTSYQFMQAKKITSVHDLLNKISNTKNRHSYIQFVEHQMPTIKEVDETK